MEVLLEHKAKKSLKNKFGETAAECISSSRQSVDGRKMRKLLGVDGRKSQLSSTKQNTRRK